jgi:hypothetical protein
MAFFAVLLLTFANGAGGVAADPITPAAPSTLPGSPTATFGPTATPAGTPTSEATAMASPKLTSDPAATPTSTPVASSTPTATPPRDAGVHADNDRGPYGSAGR